MFAYFDGSLEDFLKHITEIHDNRLVKIRLAPATTLGDIGIVSNSYHHVLDNFAVTHIIKKHSSEKEVLRGQIIIEELDFYLIPEIVSHFDSCTVEKPEDGRTLIVYSKSYQDCTRFYVEEVRKGRHELAGVTYYKRRRKLTDAKS